MAAKRLCAARKNVAIWYVCTIPFNANVSAYATIGRRAGNATQRERIVSGTAERSEPPVARERRVPPGY